MRADLLVTIAAATTIVQERAPRAVTLDQAVASVAEE